MTRNAIMRPLTIGVFAACVGASAAAQAPKIGLVHGLVSDSSTWADTKSHLMSALYPSYVDTVFTPTLPWSNEFPDQRTSFTSTYGGFLGSNTILFGHSNGGIVSRLVGQQRSLAGVVTIASPQHGAPLVDDFTEFTTFLFYVADDFTYYVDDVWNYGHRIDDLIWDIMYNLPGYLDYVSDGVYRAAGLIEGNNAVFGQMHEHDAFLENTLNGTDEVAAEAANIAISQAVVVTTYHEHYMGITRLVLSPGSADVLANVVYGMGYGAIYLGAEMIFDLDPYDYDYAQGMAVAYDLLWLGSDLLYIDNAWCIVVSSRYYQYCNDNDEIVPTWSQERPTVTSPWRITGPSHTGETSDYTTILTVLRNSYVVGP